MTSSATGKRRSPRRALPEVESSRIALSGFSLSGGHVFKVAARHDVAAAIAQTPTADGLAATPNALRHETLSVILRMPILALLDTLREALRKPPLTVPLAGARGTVAMLTTPDAQDGARALDPDGRYSDWQQTIAARSVLPIGIYRPGRDARRISAPLLVVVAENDQSALAASPTGGKEGRKRNDPHRSGRPLRSIPRSARNRDRH